MNMFMELCLAALLAVAAENVIFTGGIGFSRVLRAARKPKTIALYSCFVWLFSLASALTACYLGPVLLSNSTLLFMRPAVYAFCAALAYLLVAFVLKTFLPKIYGKVGAILSPAAINCIVLSMPYMQRSFAMRPHEAAGFAIGTGVAFFLAALVLSEALARYRNEYMPKAFRGLPSVLIYVGILSMVFVGVTGGRLFG